MARVLIVKGDEPAVERAMAFLEWLRQMATEEGRFGIIIKALAWWRRSEAAGAQ